ncbi:hypothetical protein V1512DRAFT_261260 [Lipomyces arxii]|uniref:uncharacterized protein n=1 Tax=Lipomyces arxii TaxID=56418 RepID=UPI0034CE6CAF
MSLSYSLDDVRTWRTRLFSLDEEITMTPAEYEFYFPFVDNIYKIHGRSSNSKLASLSETMYFQCRIDIRATQAKPKRGGSVVQTSDDSLHMSPSDSTMHIDPAVVASSDAFSAALLNDTSANDESQSQLLPPRMPTGAGNDDNDDDERPAKRMRNRKPRETCVCNMKIKVVRMLDQNWTPQKYIVTRTSGEGHSHDLALSDRIVKNHKLQELFNPDFPSEKKRLSARDRRALDVELVLQQIQQKYNEFEERMRLQHPNDKKRLDTTMRKWVNELQRMGDQFTALPVESFFFA